MLNRPASLAMSTSVLNALPGKLDIKRHSPSILYNIFKDLFGAVFVRKYCFAILQPYRTMWGKIVAVLFLAAVFQYYTKMR